MFSGVLQSGANDIAVVLTGTTGWNHVAVLVGESPYVTYDGSTFVLYDEQAPILTSISLAS